MKKQLIIFISIATILATSGVVFAINRDQPQINNKEVQVEDTNQTPVEQPVVQATEPTTAPEVHPDQLALPLDEPTQPAEESVPTQTPQEYAQELINKYAEQGRQGMNYNCFATLLEKKYNWSLSLTQVESELNAIIEQYPSTCAALADYTQ